MLNILIPNSLQGLFKQSHSIRKANDIELSVSAPEDFLKGENDQYLSYHFDDIQEQISDNSNLKQIFQIGSNSNGQRAIIVSLQEDRPDDSNNNKNYNSNNNLKSDKLNDLADENNEAKQETVTTVTTVSINEQNKKSSKSVNTHKITRLNSERMVTTQISSELNTEHPAKINRNDDEPIYIDGDEVESDEHKEVIPTEKTSWVNGIENFKEIISDHEEKRNNKKRKNMSKKNKSGSALHRVSSEPIDDIPVYTKIKNVEHYDNENRGDGIPSIDNKKIFRTSSNNERIDSDDDDDFDISSGSGDFNNAELNIRHNEQTYLHSGTHNYKMDANDKNWYSVDKFLTSNLKRDPYRNSPERKHLFKVQDHSERTHKKNGHKQQQHPIAYHFNSYRQSQTAPANENTRDNDAWRETRARRISGNVKKSEERSRQLLLCEDAGSGELCRMLFKVNGANSVIE